MFRFRRQRDEAREGSESTTERYITYLFENSELRRKNKTLVLDNILLKSENALLKSKLARPKKKKAFIESVRV